jgi:ribosomal protein S1
MKEIKLTKGQKTLVDDESYEWLNQWKWHAHKGRGTYYARRRDKNRATILMHRVILELDDGAIHVDHIDSDGLNNQKANLRPCSVLENRRNSRKVRILGTQYKGVTYEKSSDRYRARITVSGKVHSLGRFQIATEAAEAYNKAAIKYFGEFALINLITNEEGTGG